MATGQGSDHTVITEIMMVVIALAQTIAANWQQSPDHPVITVTLLVIIGPAFNI
jgi:hypothetical protein